MRHRYLHGGFTGTDTRFSFYLPPPDQYSGRFLQHIEGGNGGHENTAMGPLGSLGGIAFAISCGAYLVESNQGHFADDLSILRTEPTVAAYRASVISARYSRHLAAEMYGQPPEHGYVFGGSGGSPRTILCLEKAPDVYDGAIPYIMGHVTSWSLGFSVQANATRVLGAKIYSVIDAMEPGGTGNPFTGLTSGQRDALARLYRSGLPRGAEASILTSGYLGTFASHVSALMEFDPEYFQDFWSLPGYEGADGLLAASVIEKKSTVQKVVSAGDLRESLDQGVGQGNMSLVWHARGAPETPVGIVLDGIDASNLHGATLTITSGSAAGHELYCVGVHGDIVVGGADTPYRFDGVAPGDEVLVDNRRYLAYCYFHRYQVDPAAPEYAQFQLDGRPIYPQRPLFSKSGLLSGDTPTGTFAGKLIVVQNAHDAACWPNGAVSFQRLVREQLGEQADRQFRLWFMENAAHIPASMQPAGAPPTPKNRLIDYEGCLEQAIRYLIEWVEDATEPPPSSPYEIDVNQCFCLARTTPARKGIQPVVTLTVGGQARADVKPGQPVLFEASAAPAPGVGRLVAVEWDFEGGGMWELKEPVPVVSDSVSEFTSTHVFQEPGTYFAAVKVTAERNGDVSAQYGRMTNLARVRVVVS